jgi:hypothetical protein
MAIAYRFRQIGEGQLGNDRAINAGIPARKTELRISTRMMIAFNQANRDAKDRRE